MAHFETTTMARLPLAQAIVSLRDELSQVAEHLTDVARIESIERAQLADGGVRVVNVWHASMTQVPGPLARLVDEELLAWTDRAEWNAEGTACNFRVEPHFMRDNIRCQGRTQLQAAMGGRGTRIRFEGDIEVTGLPAVGAAVERVVAELVSGNLGKLGGALRASREAGR